MIIGGMEETLVKIYLCHLCGKKWLAQTGPYRITCAVAHAPGNCCHYGEELVRDDQIERIMAVLGAKGLPLQESVRP